MRTGLVNELRALLRSHPDGLSITALADMTGRDRENVTKCLKQMPDTYIDRWEGPKRGQYTAIWSIVTPPDDCPHPTKEVVAVRPRRRYDTAADAPSNRQREAND